MSIQERHQEAHQVTKGVHHQAVHQATTEAAARHQEGPDSVVEAVQDIAEAAPAAVQADTAGAVHQEQEGNFHT